MEGTDVFGSKADGFDDIILDRFKRFFKFFRSYLNCIRFQFSLV